MHLSLNEVAARAGVSFETARRWSRDGLGYRVGGRWRVDPIKLDRKLHGLPLDPIPTQELAVLLRRAADAIEGDRVDLSEPLGLVMGEVAAWVREGRIRDAAESSEVGNHVCHN